MASVLYALADVAAVEQGPALLLTDRWSYAMGWVSQIHENYVLKSTDGLSILFILIWLGGDAFNLLGGVLQGVLWTMIDLAGYYCICDLLLIWQWWYYGKYYRDGVRICAMEPPTQAPTEDTPLLQAPAARHGVLEYAVDRARALGNRFTSAQLAAINYSVTAAFVVVVGVIAWNTADSALLQACHSLPHAPEDPHVLRLDAQLLGWLSAVLYISSRIPQICKNRHTKCAGLSLALFVFAVAGNVTYVLSILLKDHSNYYLLQNASWIAGSVGTIVLDFIVLAQFIAYAPERREVEAKMTHHV
ncbi:hypothetical protein MSPP1_001653 [Malassezia sp. CBS 17886]|nr:hypothetical protein MSPP1_001653 [Malassezia sp. CBS 17886]